MNISLVILSVVVSTYLILFSLADYRGGLLKPTSDIREALNTLYELDALCGNKLKGLRMRAIKATDSITATGKLEGEILKGDKYRTADIKTFLGIHIRTVYTFTVADYDTYRMEFEAKVARIEVNGRWGG